MLKTTTEEDTNTEFNTELKDACFKDIIGYFLNWVVAGAIVTFLVLLVIIVDRVSHGEAALDEKRGMFICVGVGLIAVYLLFNITPSGEKWSAFFKKHHFRVGQTLGGGVLVAVAIVVVVRSSFLIH